MRSTRRYTLLTALLFACTPGCALVDATLPPFGATPAEEGDMPSGDMPVSPDMGRDMPPEMEQPGEDMEPDMPAQTCMTLDCPTGCFETSLGGVCQTKYPVLTNTPLVTEQDGPTPSSPWSSVDNGHLIVARLSLPDNGISRFSARLLNLSNPTQQALFEDIELDANLPTATSAHLKLVARRDNMLVVVAQFERGGLGPIVRIFEVPEQPMGSVPALDLTYSPENQQQLSIFAPNNGAAAAFTSSNRVFVGGRLCVSDGNCQLNIAAHDLGAPAAPQSRVNLDLGTMLNAQTMQAIPSGSGHIITLLGFNTPTSIFGIQTTIASDLSFMTTGTRGFSLPSAESPEAADAACGSAALLTDHRIPKHLQLINSTPSGSTIQLSALASLVNDSTRRGLVLFSNDGAVTRVRCQLLNAYNTTTLLASLSESYSYASPSYRAVLKGRRTGDTIQRGILVNASNALQSAGTTTRDLRVFNGNKQELAVIDAVTLTSDNRFLVLAADANRGADSSENVYLFEISAQGSLTN